MRRLALAAVLAAGFVALAAAPRPAAAEARLVLDRVTVEPSPLWGQARLRVFATAVDLSTGGVVPVVGSKAWTLKISGADKRLPYLMTTYDGGQYLTAIAIVVETTSEYATDLAAIQTVLDEELLARLPALTAQAVVFGYSDKPTATPKFAPAKQAITKLRALTAATEPTEPALLDAIERAIAGFKKLETDPPGQPVRKMILVVSDGRDKTDDRPRVTSIGKRAGKEGIRIHTLAFSPSDTRRPLLVLGELAKRSGGTFRWVRTAAGSVEQSMREQTKGLRAEIDGQYVLTYFVPLEDIAGKKVSLVADLRGKPIESQPVKVPQEATCGGEVCAGVDSYCVSARCVQRGDGEGRGVLGWILLIGGIVVGVIVGLGLIGYVLTKRKHSAERRAQLAIAAGLASAPPGMAAAGMPSSAPPAGGLGADGRIQGVPYAGYQSSAPPQHPQQPAYAPPVQQIQAIGAGQSTAMASFGYGGGGATPTLYIMGGPRAGERVPLRHGFAIGKDPSSDLRIDDGFASGHHAMILMDARGNCSVQDRGSTNGTFVNGVRIHEPVALSHGMTIKVGSTDLRFLAQ